MYEIKTDEFNTGFMEIMHMVDNDVVGAVNVFYDLEQIAAFYGKTAKADAEAYIQMKEQQATAVKNITESDLPDQLRRQAS